MLGAPVGERAAANRAVEVLAAVVMLPAALQVEVDVRYELHRAVIFMNRLLGEEVIVCLLVPLALLLRMSRFGEGVSP